MLVKATSPGWVILMLTLTGSLLAQTGELPPTPVPVAPPLSPAPSAGLIQATPPTPLTYAPPPPAVFAPGPVIGPIYDPGDPCGPCGQACLPPGWYFDTEIAMVFPSLKFNLMNDQPLPLTGLQLHVPAVDLSTTVMPTFELGYRLPDCAGLFALSYSFLYTEGTGQRSTIGGNADVKTRLGINWLDLDYGTMPYEFAPRYQVSWRLGARVANVEFDSQASNAALTQSARNEFLGAGPHVRMDLERRIVPLPGLSLFGRADGAVFVGQVKQNFNVTLPGGVTDGTTVKRTQTVPYVNLQAGLSYTPPSLPALKITGGYLFEDYFSVGRLGISGQGEVSQSRGEVWSHGWFLRARYDY